MSAVLVTALALAGCSSDDAAPVEAEALDTAGEAACAAFLDDLPPVLEGALLTCGAPEPAALEPTSVCDRIRGVEWFIDPDELGDPDATVTVTAIGVRPRVAVVFPVEERGQRSMEVLSALADPVSEHLERVSRCG